MSDMKLKNFYLLLTFFICASVFCSCSKKERAMDRLESFTEKLEQKSNNYSSNDTKIKDLSSSIRLLTLVEPKKFFSNFERFFT